MYQLAEVQLESQTKGVFTNINYETNRASSEMKESSTISCTTCADSTNSNQINEADKDSFTVVSRWLYECTPVAHKRNIEKAKRQLNFSDVQDDESSVEDEINPNGDVDSPFDDTDHDPNYDPDCDSDKSSTGRPTETWYDNTTENEIPETANVLPFFTNDPNYDPDCDSDKSSTGRPTETCYDNTTENEIPETANVLPFFTNDPNYDPDCDSDKSSTGRPTETCYDNTTENEIPETVNGFPLQLQKFEAALPKYEKPKYATPYKQTSSMSSNGRNALRYFCAYCYTDVAQLPRHLESKHSTEILVKRALAFSKGSKERIEIWTALRLWGNHIFNDIRIYNKGMLRVARRPAVQPRSSDEYTMCHSCGSLVLRSRFSSHYHKCINLKKPLISHDHLKQSASLRTDLLYTANDILRERIFPVMKNDRYLEAIKYDRAIIAYGNNITRKFITSTHNDKMIRANLRMLARILVTSREIFEEDPNISKQKVTDFASLCCPPSVTLIEAAVYRLGDFNVHTATYKHPGAASLAVRLIKKVAEVWVTQCVRDEDKVTGERTNAFLDLFRIDVQPIINKTITENRTALQRDRVTNLPTVNDLTNFISYLKNRILDITKTLQRGFNSGTWKSLGCYLAAYITTFNRRRPGEVERMFLSNYKNIIQLDSTSAEYLNLSEHEKQLADRFYLFVIRGKLNRTVNVLIDSDLKSSLDMFILLRETAEVPSQNPFVFGLPSVNDSKFYKYIDCCRYIRIFAHESNVSNPDTIRSTKLRKSFATFVSVQNLPENAVNDVAEHLGHDTNIHKNIYRQATYQRSVLTVAAALENSLSQNPTNSLPLEEHNTTKTSDTSIINTTQLSPESNSSYAFADVNHQMHDLYSSPRHFSADADVGITIANENEQMQKNVNKNISDTRKESVQKLKSSRLPLKHSGSSCSTPRKLIGRSSGFSLTPNQQSYLKAYFVKSNPAGPVMDELQKILKHRKEFQNVSLPHMKIYVDNLLQKTNSPRNKFKGTVRQYQPTVNRKGWSKTELDMLWYLYKDCIQNSNMPLPSTRVLNRDREIHPEITDRTAQLIKAQLSNLRKRNNKVLNYN